MTSIRRLFAASVVALAACAALAQKPEPRVRLELAGAKVLGNTQAPLTMVEFSDYECTFCQQYHATAFVELKRDFIDTGKLRYVVRDYPLPTHRNAARAARAAHCAADQGRFWEMHAALLKLRDGYGGASFIANETLARVSQLVTIEPAPGSAR